jgi:hypothetical protein
MTHSSYPSPGRGRVASPKRVYARLRRAMASRVGASLVISSDPTPIVLRTIDPPLSGEG